MAELGVWGQVTAAILTTPVFPFLWLPHCLVMCLALRATLGSGAQALQFAMLHPLTCYSLGVLYTFSGAMTGLILRNLPVLTILTWSNNFYSFTVVWYLMFFAPGDFLYRLLTKFPITPLLVVAQDCLRLGNVRNGVAATLKDHPHLFLYPVVFASLTSNGFMFVKYIEKSLQTGFHQATVVKHHASKTMVVTALLLTAQAQGHLPMGAEDLYCGLVVAAVCLRLLTTFVLKDWDPYCSAETQVCRLLYGKPGSVAGAGGARDKKD